MERELRKIWKFDKYHKRVNETKSIIEEIDKKMHEKINGMYTEDVMIQKLKFENGFL
jgi:hypothetical protein